MTAFMIGYGKKCVEKEHNAVNPDLFGGVLLELVLIKCKGSPPPPPLRVPVRQITVNLDL